MKTLDEANKEFEERYEKARERINLSGVACPKCKENKKKEVEMYIDEPGLVNLSNPPTRWVTCSECGYRGLQTL